MRIIGIDPGESGGAVELGHAGQVVDKIRFNKATEQERSKFFSNPKGGKTKVFIERVASMPQQGVVSTFTFGRNYGFLRACLFCFGHPFDDITPKTWQSGLKIVMPPKKINPKTGKPIDNSTEKKNCLKGHAQRLFPEEKITLDIADAYLIAEYGRRHELGVL